MHHPTISCWVIFDVSNLACISKPWQNSVIILIPWLLRTMDDSPSIFLITHVIRMHVQMFSFKRDGTECIRIIHGFLTYKLSVEINCNLILAFNIWATWSSSTNWILPHLLHILIFWLTLESFCLVCSFVISRLVDVVMRFATFFTMRYFLMVWYLWMASMLNLRCRGSNICDISHSLIICHWILLLRIIARYLSSPWMNLYCTHQTKIVLTVWLSNWVLLIEFSWEGRVWLMGWLFLWSYIQSRQGTWLILVWWNALMASIVIMIITLDPSIRVICIALAHLLIDCKGCISLCLIRDSLMVLGLTGRN